MINGNPGITTGEKTLQQIKKLFRQLPADHGISHVCIIAGEGSDCDALVKFMSRCARRLHFTATVMTPAREGARRGFYRMDVMSWRGRKRKAGMRERNGRIKRPPSPARNIMSVALAQPHRHGQKNPKDPLHASPLGKFVLSRELDRNCYDAALDFAKLTRKVFASLGVPQPVGDGRQVTGRALDAEIVQRLRCELDEIETRLRSIGRAGFDALRQLALFERETPPEQAEAATLACKSWLNEKTA